MADLEVLSKILAGINISTKHLKKYDFDLENVSSITFLMYYAYFLPGVKIPIPKIVELPFLGVNPDYFNQYIKKLKNKGICYEFFEKPYRYLILKEAKFAIRDDLSYVNTLPHELKNIPSTGDIGVVV